MRTRPGPVVLALVALVAAGCSAGSKAPAPGRLAAPATTTAPAGAAAQAPNSPGAQRAGFEQLLGRQTLLQVRLMRAVVFGAPDLRRATQVAADQNAAELATLVAATYDQAAGTSFDGQNRRTLADLVAYADAVGRGDGKGGGPAGQARTALMADARAYGAWLAGASHGRAKAPAAEAAMRAQLERLTGQADAYAARDYGRSYELEREAFEQAYAGGAGLATAGRAADAAGTDTPTERLRSAFAQLLGEHMELVIDAQRATFAGAAEFKAAAAQVNHNSQAIGAAVGTLAGPAKGEEFSAGWADHVDKLMAYTAAVAKRDPNAQAAAETQLDRFATTLARFFHGLVGDQLALGSLLGVLTLHDRHLTDHVDAYAARDFTSATAIEREGYAHIHGVADSLVGALGRSMRPGLPVGAAQTGGGGLAGR